MLSAADFERLKNRVASVDAKDWHWHGKDCIFDDVKEALEKLGRANDSRALELRAILKVRMDVFLKSGFKEAAGAIGQLVVVENHSGVWSAPDVPVDFYTDMSEKNLTLPDAVSFALSQGGVLQSAREAVNYRLLKGKDDLNYYYHTRTVAIYFMENNNFFVAFDDDAFDNILLLRAKEGYDAGDNWLVNVNDSLVRNAILRAKSAGRMINVTDESTRSDSLAVSKSIIGDKTDAYNDFLKKHLGRELKAYVLNRSDCRAVSQGEALIRLVGLGSGNDCIDNLDANNQCNNSRRARGVRKFSIGNRGWVSYVGLLLFKKLRLNEAGVSSYFAPFEAQLKDNKAVSLFYAGLGACRDFINIKNDLDGFVNALVALVKGSPGHLPEFFSAISKLSQLRIVFKSDELALIAKDFSVHPKMLSDPVRLVYWLELRRNNVVNKHLGLLERLRLRRESGFKDFFLKNLFRQKYGIDVDASDLPFNTLMSMFECDKVTKEIIAEAQSAINRSHKAFPTNKTYYYQTAKGITIQTATPEIVQQTLINIIVITLTPQKRWEARHDAAALQVNALVNNKQKIDDLINFARSCINQGAAFNNIKKLFEDLKNRKQTKEELLKSIEEYFQAITSSKYSQLDQTMLSRKIEPLNDILILLKSQLREQETGTAVAIISQKPRITDLMDYDTTHCCAFFPYYNEEGAMDYIEDDNIGLLQYFVMSGRKRLNTIYGVIIFAICEDQGKNTVLLIDSAEGDENMLKIVKHWQEAYHECIKKLAKDIGAKQVIYNADAGNTVPREFLKYIAGKFQKSRAYLCKKGDLKGEPYLESFEGDVPKGYVDGFVESV